MSVLNSSLGQFTEFLSSLELSELTQYRKAVDSEILKKLPNNSHFDCSNPKSSASKVLNVTPAPHNIEDFICHSDNFIDETVEDLLSAEIQSLNFNRHTRSNALQNCFLSEFSDPYIWPSAKGPVVNNPKNIDHFPVMKNIMKRISESHKCNLNSVLVTYYINGSTSIPLHDDSEETIDSSQPICVLSLGATR